MKYLAPVALAALLMAGGCSDDEATSTTSAVVDTAPTTDPVVTAPPDLPRDLTSGEVCALVDTDTIAAALGATEVEAAPGDFGTPQCSYTFQATDGSFTNLVTAVQRAVDDLDGRVGADGFEYAVELNALFAGDAEFVDVPGVGDRATFAQGQLGLLIAQVGPRVFTVAGGVVDQEAATAIGTALAAALAAID